MFCMIRPSRRRGRTRAKTLRFNVSHELRTPLTSVKSYLEALDEGALYDPVVLDFIKVSLDETNRMMRMVTDLFASLVLIMRPSVGCGVD